jgi:putative permease
VIAAILSAAALIGAGIALSHTVSCFLLAFVIAYLLEPYVVLLEKRRCSRLLAISIIYLQLAVLSIFVVAYLVPFLNLRWESLVRELPHYLQKGKEIVLGWQGNLSSTYTNDEWRWLFGKITGSFDRLLGKFGAGVYAAATSFAFNLFNLVLAPILVFFMLLYKQEVLNGVIGWIPASRREMFIELGREINASIGGYIRGQLIVSLIVAILSTLALMALDIDYPLLNGIFAGLASILPFIGVILATLPPLFFAYIKFQSGLMLVKVLGLFSIIYFLEGYLVKPLVFKEAMDLNPLMTIIVVMAFGELMGFWGIVLAIPIAASVKIIAYHLRRGDFSGGA